MTRKHGIRAPRKPKGEDPQVTIANQDKQIKLLIDRVDFLTKEVEFHQHRYERSGESHRSERAIWDASMQDFNDKSIAYTRIQGWQDCAREIIQQLIDK